MNAFKQLDLKISSPICLPPFVQALSQSVTNSVSVRGRRGQRSRCESSGVTWEHAGVVHGTHQRAACPCSEDGGSRRGRVLHRRYYTPQGNWRLRVLNGLCTRKFNGLRGMIPTFRAHLRRTFLIMSVADITYTPCFDQMHRLREGAGDHMRRYHRLLRSPQPSAIAGPGRHLNPAGWPSAVGAEGS